MTRSAFDQFIDKAIQAIALPKIDGSTACDTLKTLGFQSIVDFSPSFFDSDVRWEHPEMTRHNKRQGSDGILNQGFFTLYAKVTDYEESSYKFCGEVTITPAHSIAYAEFLIGRVGNTFSLHFSSPIEAEVPQPSAQEEMFT
jgi:hypothetical protein